MSPEPIRDYVGEVLARHKSTNGKAATFDTNSGGDDAMSARNSRPASTAVVSRPNLWRSPAQEREWQQQEQSAPPPRELQWKVGSFTAEQLQTMKVPADVVPGQGGNHPGPKA